MGKMKEIYSLNEVTNSLDQDGKNYIKRLHEQAIFWGYTPKISMGKRTNDWKCEYIKNKIILYILKIANDKWVIKCKFFNIMKYETILEKCNKKFLEEIIENANGCGNHGGGCKGPIDFLINGKRYSKCRHSFVFNNLNNEGVNNIQTLLECENNYI
jgi:hypothetical protein